jgi:hypothetical protein
LRALLVFFAVVIASPHVAAAEDRVGVLVTGEYLRRPTEQQTEMWLRNRERKPVVPALPTDAIKTLLDCFVIDDPKCSRSVVDARALTETLISVRVDVGSKKDRDIRLTMDWFVKGHPPVSSRRTCDGCTEEVLRKTIDAMLGELSKTVPGFLGHLSVKSDPPGITVMLDNATIGVTPLESDVPVGRHKVQLARDGRTTDGKIITVTADSAAEIKMDPPAAGGPESGASTVQRPSRLVPGLFIGLGVAAIGAGTALYLTSEEPTGKSPTYRDTKPLGIGVAAGGGALVIVGVIIVVATKPSSTPTVSVLPEGGAAIGWAGSF